MIQVRHSPALMEHLRTFEVDGATVAGALFDGGRLSYPGRRQLEHELSYIEPYTLEHEARVIEGLSTQMRSSIRFLAREAYTWRGNDQTLELLWRSHEAYSNCHPDQVSLDRLVAALVMVQELQDSDERIKRTLNFLLEDAAALVVRELHATGFPPNELGLEELFDGAPPAAVGLGLVHLY